MWKLQGQAPLLPHPPQAPPNLRQGRQKQNGKSWGRSNTRSGFSCPWFRSYRFVSSCRWITADGVWPHAASSSSVPDHSIGTCSLGSTGRTRCCFWAWETSESSGCSLQPVSSQPVSCTRSRVTALAQSQPGQHNDLLAARSTWI